MNIKKTTLSLALLASCFIVTGASAESEVKNTPEQTLEAFNKKISQASPGLGPNSTKLDFTIEGFQKEFGDNYLPVELSGQRYIIDTEANVVMETSKTYMFNTKNELLSVNDVLVKLELLSDKAKDFTISHTLPEGVEKKADLFVLTDPTCGYCHKVEEEVEQYLNSGVVIHYVPYPRAGVVDVTNAGFSLWAKAACAAEPAKAYHDVSLRKGSYADPESPDAACTEVIKKGYAFGRKINISGTPFMFAVDNAGDSFSSAGYVPYTDMTEQLGIRSINLAK